MKVKFKPCRLNGNIDAPPSKSMAHRYLIGAALSKQNCKISGIDYSEDILASIDCLKALGAEITIDNDVVSINSTRFMKNIRNISVEDATIENLAEEKEWNDILDTGLVDGFKLDSEQFSVEQLTDQCLKYLNNNETRKLIRIKTDE